MKEQPHVHGPEHQHEYKSVMLSLLVIIAIGILILFIVVMNALYWNPVNPNEELEELEEELEFLAADVVFTNNIEVVNPLTRVIDAIDFEETSGEPWPTVVAGTRTEREEMRASSCFGFNSIVNDKEIVKLVDPRIFTDEDKSEISAQVSGFVTNDAQFYQRLEQLVGTGFVDGVLEICAGSENYYLTGMKLGAGKVEIFEIIPKDNQISLEEVTSIDAFYQVYELIPDYFEGLPLIVSSFADGGYEAWNFYTYDAGAHERMLIESCNVVYELGSDPVVGEQTCTREYKPE